MGSTPFDTNNPGIGGMDEITSAEEVILANLAALGDPNADRILFWDDSEGAFAYLTIGSGLSIVGATITATAGSLDGSGTTNEIAYWVDSDTLGALAVATYPSLTELSYVKGVTSAIQTQLNAKAATALSNLASVAINTTLVSDTDNTDALGTAAIGWSDLFLGSGAVITFSTAPSTADVTITHSANLLTIAGGDLALGANNITMTGSLGATGARLTAGWFADLTVTNAIAGSITGNAATVTVADAGGDTTTFVMLATAATGSLAPATDAGLSYDASTNILTAGGLALGSGNLTLTGSIAATGSRVTKGWFTDLEVTNDITINGTALATTYLAKAGGTLTGSITLGENTGIALDPAGSADGKWSGITIAGTSGYTQAFGDLVYLDPTDSRWEAVDANAAAGADGDARGTIGMVVSAGTDGNSCTILLIGVIRADANFPALTIGSPVYASETAGDIVTAQPTTTDAVIRVVGFALTADEIFFNPSSDYITHT